MTVWWKYMGTASGLVSPGTVDPIVLSMTDVMRGSRNEKDGVVVQRKFAPMLARQLTGGCQC